MIIYKYNKCDIKPIIAPSNLQKVKSGSIEAGLSQKAKWRIKKILPAVPLQPIQLQGGAVKYILF